MPDIMSPEKRSALMSRIKGQGTKPELAVARELARLGLRPRQHVAGMPGRPDFVFIRARIAVFIDGDFWHGWRFPLWQHKLTPFWREKIAGNRARDQRNMRRLRRAGWTVVRIWEHQLERDMTACIGRITSAVDAWRRTAADRKSA
jgi:DNA mismatch endonuclease (patch repair protein)